MKQTPLALSLGLLFLVGNGCAVMSHVPGLNIIYSGPTKRNTAQVEKAQARTDEANARITTFKKSLLDKTAALRDSEIAQGVAFVYGTGKALDRATNREPAITLAKDLNSLAAQALPKPTTASMQELDQVIKDCLLSKDAGALARGAQEFEGLKTRLANTEKQLVAVTKTFEAKISVAEEKYDARLAQERVKSDTAAVKANKFDQANSLVGSFELFVKNGWKLFTVIIGIVVVGSIVWFGLKIYGLSNPAVGAGMKVASSVLGKGFSEIVAGGERFKTYLENSGLAADAKNFVLDLFRRGHMEAQSQDTQAIIAGLTKPVLPVVVKPLPVLNYAPPTSSPTALPQAATPPVVSSTQAVLLASAAAGRAIC